MKNLIIIFVALSFFGCEFQDQPDSMIKENRSATINYWDWNGLNDISAQRDGTEIKVLIMGDSTMEIGDTWDYLPTDWTVINVAKGTTSSVGVYNRRHFISEQLPDYIVLGVGMNDCLLDYDLNSFVVYYSAILQEAEDNGIPVLCIQISDPWGVAYPESLYRNILIINMLQGRPDAHYIHVGATIWNMDGSLIHFKPEFYEDISILIENKINEIEGGE